MPLHCRDDEEPEVDPFNPDELDAYFAGITWGGLPGTRHRDAEFMESAHIEHYNGDAANVSGRVRLEPESTAALQREISRTPPAPPVRQARSPLMQQRLAKARRDVLRRVGNVA